MSKKVLILDDRPEVCDLLVETLKEKNVGLEPLVAYDPMKALDLFHSNKSQISVVISDYFMPVENGAEFCRIIKDNKPDTFVILFTANGELDPVTLEGIVDKYIVKTEGAFKVADAIREQCLHW
jgi:CheY-like chemotaxis protein